MTQSSTSMPCCARTGEQRREESMEVSEGCTDIVDGWVGDCAVQ